VHFLRLSDIQEALGPEVDREKQSQYIENWIEREILYRHAKKSIRMNPRMRKQIREYRRELIVREYCQQEIRKDISVNENDVLTYYRDNPGEFIISEPGAFVELYISKKKDALDDVADHLRRAQSPPLPARLEFVRRGEYVAPLDQRIFDKSNPSLIGPLKIDDHFYLISIIERYTANSRLRVEHVRDQIIQKQEMQKYMNAYQQKLKDLKEQFNVKIYKASY
jgi:hypothetical protein